MIVWFLSLILFMCCIVFLGLHMLNHPCIPGMKPTGSWYMIFTICCWVQFASVFLRIFVSMIIREIVLLFFWSWPYPILEFWYQGNTGFIQWVLKYFFPLL
jgi:hypothetical protein